MINSPVFRILPAERSEELKNTLRIHSELGDLHFFFLPPRNDRTKVLVISKRNETDDISFAT